MALNNEVSLWLPWQQSYHSMRYVAEPIVQVNLYGLNMTQEERVIDVSLWLPWQQSYHNNEEYAWCLSFQRAPIPNINLI